MSSTTMTSSMTAAAAPSTFHVVQIGCGVVGYPYAVAYRDAGNRVSCIEANRKLIDLYKKELPMYHIHDDLSTITDVDFIMISINTPLKGHGLDLSYLFSSIPNVATIVKNSPKALVVIRSTVPPLTCKDYKDQLEQTLNAKVDVLFQPEFLRACSAYDDAMHPWHVVLGRDPETDCSRILQLYSKFIDPSKITLMTVEEAEFQKVMHNCFNACKISFFNQCHLLVNSINSRHGINIDIDAITKSLVHTCEGLKNARYGTKTGHAYYGTCLPKDSAELARLEQVYGLPVPMFESVVGVNNVVKAMDKEEVLDGDHHMAFTEFK
jgi:UDPglucose 6-dehydrogenase